MNPKPSQCLPGRAADASAPLRLAAVLAALLLLSACAADYEPVDAAAPVEVAAYDKTVDACRARAAASGHGEATLAGAAAGVLYGAAQGAISGAVWGGNSAEGAAIGAAAGFVVGAVIGAVGDTSGYAASMDSCMASEGYRRT